MISALPMSPLCEKSSRWSKRERISFSSNMQYCASVFWINSWLKRMSRTFSLPMNCCASAKRKDSLRSWRVNVSVAWMIFARTLYVLSSAIKPDGTSILTIFAGLWLIYFTKEAKPPAKGLLSPEPNKPSITNVSAVNSGGSNFAVISVKSFACLLSSKRWRFVTQSSDRWLVILKR